MSTPSLESMFALWNTKGAKLAPTTNGHRRLTSLVKLDEKIKQVRTKSDSEPESHHD